MALYFFRAGGSPRVKAAVGARLGLDTRGPAPYDSPMSVTPRILGYGVDTLVVNLYWPEGTYGLPDGLEDTLTRLKDLFRVSPDSAILWGVDAYFPFPNPAHNGGDGLFESAVVQPTRHYAWQLSFGSLVFVRLSSVKDSTRRREFPAVRVEVTGTYMMYVRRDAGRVIQWILDAAENLTGVRPERVQVSRVDLFVDVEVPHGFFTLEDIHRFTSRSRLRCVYSVAEGAPGLHAGAPSTASGGAMSNTPPATRLQVSDSLAESPETATVYLRGREWSGFVFGRGPLMARIYSKTLEARTKPVTRSLLSMYEDRHGPITGQVVRVEFQLTTDVLREMVVVGDGSDIRDWSTFVWAIPSVWAYLTREWLVLRDGARAHSYGRMRDVPIDRLWEVVQAAFDTGRGDDTGGLVRDNQLFRRVDTISLLKQSLGAFMTALVSVGLVHVDLRGLWVGVFRALGSDTEEREKLGKEAAVAYGKALQRRLAAFGLMPEQWRFEGVGG